MDPKEEKENRRIEALDQEKIERALVMLKPEALDYGKFGTIMKAYERRGLRVVYMREMLLSEEQIEKFYYKYVSLAFWPNMVRLLVNGITVVLILEGHLAMRKIRTLHGYYSPEGADPGTIRFDLGPGLYSGTVVHCADSKENAIREIKILLGEGSEGLLEV